MEQWNQTCQPQTNRERLSEREEVHSQEVAAFVSAYSCTALNCAVLCCARGKPGLLFCIMHEKCGSHSLIGRVDPTREMRLAGCVVRWTCAHIFILWSASQAVKKLYRHWQERSVSLSVPNSDYSTTQPRLKHSTFPIQPVCCRQRMDRFNRVFCLLSLRDFACTC